MRALYLVLHVVKAALPELHGTNVQHIRVISSHRDRESAGIVLDIRLFPDLRSDVCNLRKICGERIQVFLREADVDTGFLPTGSHRSLARNHDAQLRTEIREDIRTGLPES